MRFCRFFHFFVQSFNIVCTPVLKCMPNVPYMGCYKCLEPGIVASGVQAEWTEKCSDNVFFYLVLNLIYRGVGSCKEDL